MPNNASAKRGKKNKDKKKKDNEKTGNPPLPKEDTSRVDSGTLSLSSAGKDKASKDKASTLPLVGKDVEPDLSDPRYLELMLASRTGRVNKDGNSKDTARVDNRKLSLSLSSKEQEEQDLSLALVRMEEAIQKHAAGEAGEPDWENANWACVNVMSQR